MPTHDLSDQDQPRPLLGWLDTEAGDDETVLDAARACPVDAITLIDQYHD